MSRFTRAMIPLLFAPLLLGCPDPTTPPVENDEARRQMQAAADAYLEMWTTADFTALDTLIAAGYERHFSDTTLSGREGLRNNIMQNHNAFSNLSIRLEETLFEGNLSAARFVFSGTNDGPMMGMPATNQRVETWGVSILRHADGQIQEEWVAVDQADMLRQLGHMPPAPAAPAEVPPAETPAEEPPADDSPELEG